eukprot:CAMPEP_0185030290 /NCGR_PEP_ID=MMETSP1103-20130426/17167_1 /TAXON_ID=36769 /ORGANISM="Paraphysomonas bandaiensis, Strain Caron Lab Isolate" /LENGTH=547 /DNA_ID=CAMNT_0027565357 /DNA_START=97 /DNA_END=1740 /DNA_ORIENTATION=-
MEFLADDSAIWNGNERFLTREVLNGIQEKSGTQISRKRSFSRNSKFTVEKENELPFRTQEFLKKIGIEDTSVNDPTKSWLASHNEQKTKLVGHVFDCLNALEQLVQLDQDTDNANVDETQSVCDRNTKSVGKLVHELVTIYGLCGDSLKVLLDSQPAAAAVEDTAGRMALHVAVDKHKPWIRLVETLIAAYPDACKSRDGGGRLPLHIAVDRNSPCIEVVKLVINAFPDAASMRRGVGRLPIHYAVFYDQPDVDVVRFLLETYKLGAQRVDVYGRLPLHYAVDRDRPCLEVVECLLDAFADAAYTRDTSSRLPLAIAVDHGEHTSIDVVQLLVNVYPGSVMERGPQGRLPLHVAVDASRPNLSIVRYLSRLYPASVTIPISESKGDTPLSICATRNLNSLVREMLLARPELDPEKLRELNWQSRRAAVLISIPRNEMMRYGALPGLVNSLSLSPSCGSLNDMCDVNSRIPEKSDSDFNAGIQSVYRQQGSITPDISMHQGMAYSSTSLSCGNTDWDIEHKKYSAIQDLYASLFLSNYDIWREVICFL